MKTVSQALRWCALTPDKKGLKKAIKLVFGDNVNPLKLTNKDYKRIYKTYLETTKSLYREEYNDYEWFMMMKSLGENLPIEYCDVFNRDGEISEDYDNIFNINIYRLIW